MKKTADFSVCFTDFIKLSERDTKGKNALIKCTTTYNLTDRRVETTLELSQKQIKDFIPKLDKLEASFTSSGYGTERHYLNKNLSDYPPAYSIIEKMNSILAYKTVEVGKREPLEILKEINTKNKGKLTSMSYMLETKEDIYSSHRNTYVTTNFYPDRAEDKQYSFAITKYVTVPLNNEVTAKFKMKETDNKTTLEINRWIYDKKQYRPEFVDNQELKEILTTGSLAIIKVYLEGVVDDYNKLESKEKQTEYLSGLDEKYINKMKLEFEYADSRVLQDKLKCVEKINNLYVDLMEKEDKVEKENDNYDYGETSEN